MPRLRALLSLFTALPALSCVGTTGGDLFTFDAAAAGPLDADPGRPFTFTTGLGYQVTLTRAKVHIGAAYLSNAALVSVSQETSCIRPGVYIAEVTHGLDVDALSPDPQPFPGKGEAIQDHGVAGEVWLTGGEVNAPDDQTVILDVAGTAEKNGASYPFEGALTIGENRAAPTNNPAQPGANPICKERIVSGIRINITPRAGGHLLVRVDPRGFFTEVEFSALEQASSGPPLYRFLDETTAAGPNQRLYANLKTNDGIYKFTWVDQPMSAKEHRQ